MGSQSSNFRRISDNKEVDISTLTDNEKETLYYKDEPYTTAKLHQRLIVTYSPKYAAYQKQVRQKQIDRATKMVEKKRCKKAKKKSK